MESAAAKGIGHGNSHFITAVSGTESLDYGRLRLSRVEVLAMFDAKTARIRAVDDLRAEKLRAKPSEAVIFAAELVLKYVHPTLVDFLGMSQPSERD
jgi:hypothetical protein